ncbi:MGDG synthase family glycosyltransferase [Undibacterium sp. WLX3042]|uniref:MGDG synthase family glycosyltransferase n=1 Tax=Undibacterium sp. WLX3042 TaxID=3412686 RepID=UPI003C2F513C
MRKKILLLSVSAGSGHRRAAEALLACTPADEQVEIRHLDVMDFVTAGFRKIYTDFYIRLVSRAPLLWGYLYHATNSAQANSILEKLRRGVERLNARPLKKMLTSFQPDAIICTHFLPAEMLSHLLQKSELNCPVWVQVTDFDLHRMWVHDNMAGYFAANVEVAERMRQNGIPAQKIHVTGIPVMPGFMQRHDRRSCATEYGLDPHKPTVLLMGGGAGVGDLDKLTAHLLRLETPFQLITLAGNNTQMLHKMQALAQKHPGKLLPLGYSNQVERLMACADLVITKPGGLTTSECLASGVAMIVTSPIPGQEERNADFLLEQGVALKAYDQISLAYRLNLLLSQPEKLYEMRRKALTLGKPHAAADVLTRVLKEDAILTEDKP